MYQLSRSLVSFVFGLGLLGACGRSDGGGGGGGGTGPGTCLTGCARGFSCQAGVCAVDPTGSWILTVTGGTVSQRDADGLAWDVPGGLPDPLVCLRISGQRTCTSAARDTLSPQWGMAFPAATATALQSGVGIEYLDEDPVSNDSICLGTQPVRLDDFLRGAWSVTCEGGLGGFSATLGAR